MTEEWTTSYFDQAYLRRWRLGPPTARIVDEAASLVAMLGARAGSRLLDVGCGQGRYSIAFARQGIRVVGVDASPVLLEEAARLANAEGTPVAWVRADMRHLPYSDEFDHVVVMDALGFFATEEEDRLELACIGRALRADGTAVVKVANGERILSSFEPRARREAGGGTIETAERELIAGGDRMVERITLEVPGGEPLVTRREQRLYSRERLARLVSEAGLIVEGVAENAAGTPAGVRSHQLYLLARSPRSS